MGDYGDVKGAYDKHKNVQTHQNINMYIQIMLWSFWKYSFHFIVNSFQHFFYLHHLQSSQYYNVCLLYNPFLLDLVQLAHLFSYIVKLPWGNDLESASQWFPVVTSDGNLTGIIEAQILAATVLNLQEAAGFFFFFRFLKGETLQSVSQAKKMWHYEKILGLNKSTFQPILDEKSILVQICHFPEVLLQQDHKNWSTQTLL